MTRFPDLLKILADSDCRTILIGGAAAIAHGSGRFTQDLDFLYERSRTNLERLVSALAPYQPYLRGAPEGLPFRWELETLLRGLNFTLTTTLGDIDLLGEIPGGGSYEQLIEGSVELKVFGSRVRCLSLRQLIRAKRATGRAKDMEAIAELECMDEESD